MRDDQSPKTTSPGPMPSSRLARLFRRLDHAKLTVTTALLFFVFLAVLSGLATGISYVGHHHVVRR